MDIPLFTPLRAAVRRRPRRSLRTARCLLVDADRHLLVVHAGRDRHRRPRWGLPGGHIDFGEAPDAAVRRELMEELYLTVPELDFVDDYHYKGNWHRVYTARSDARIDAFDDRELLEVGWFTVDEVQELADEDALHAGYEIDVVRLLCAQQDTSPSHLRVAG